jgi:hypothetical protein
MAVLSIRQPWMVRDRGLDGTRPGVETRVSADEPDGPQVCRGDEVCQQHLDLAIGRDPVCEERPMICLGIDRPPQKTHLYELEPERDED